MKLFKYELYLAFFMLMFVVNSCNSQTNNKKNMSTSLINRKPIVAGQFYAGNETTLKQNLEQMFANAQPLKSNGEVMAIISPHAGYVFSGGVAASSFNQLDKNKKYKTIFVIGSSHRVYFDGASVYNLGNYETPLGVVQVDLNIANELIDNNSCFTYRQDAHSNEHSLEVQLPFLQYCLKENFQIVPIVIATQSISTCKDIAKALKPYFTTENLFVISTDFSHYPKYEDANMIDKLTAEAILTKNPKMLDKALRNNEKKRIKDLATSLCGWTSVTTLMYITEEDNNINYYPVEYKNSGDAKLYGDKSGVVGYYAIAIEKITGNQSEKAIENENLTFSLTEKEKKELLGISRYTLEEYVKNGKIPDIDSKSISSALKTNCGVFVSLYKNGDLRGCIGNFGQEKALYEITQEITISSCSQDYRFEPVTEKELDNITIEISVLTPLKKINSIDEIELGKHGIYIKKGYRSGTFLPQVADKTGWTLEEFLGNCAKNKAGIGWDGWKEADIYTYEAIIFKEK